MYFGLRVEFVGGCVVYLKNSGYSLSLFVTGVRAIKCRGNMSFWVVS